MKATLLIITLGDQQEITIHETDTVAWTQLIKFVDAKWSLVQKHVSPPINEAERARLFFTRDQDSYVIAEVDLTGVADALGIPKELAGRQCPR